MIETIQKGTEMEASVRNLVDKIKKDIGIDEDGRPTDVEAAVTRLLDEIEFERDDDRLEIIIDALASEDGFSRCRQCAVFPGWPEFGRRTNR